MTQTNQIKRKAVKVMRDGKVGRLPRFFALSLAFLLSFFSFMPILSTIDVHAAEGDPAPIPAQVSIDPTMKISGSTATADITVDRLSGNAAPVTVYYHTENLSAVAGVDYKATSGSVDILGASAQISVSIYPNSSPYATNDGSTTYGRQFRVVIDRVDGGNVTERNASVCTLGGAMNIPITISPGLAYADVYAKLDSKKIDNWEVDDDSDETRSNIFDNTSGWGDYVSRGLATAYTATTISNMDHSIASANTKVYYWLKDAGNNTFLYFRDETCTSGGKRLTMDEWGKVLGESNPHSGYGNDALDCTDIDLYSGREYLYTTSLIGGPTGWFARVPLSGNKINVTVEIENTASFYHIYYTAYHYIRLVDTSVPKVTATYLDDSALSTTGKLRLSVRFSEPVRSKSTDLSTIEVAIKRADGSFGEQKLTFSYAGGNFTDTLYYECPLSTGASVYGYKIAAGDDRVVDLSYCVNSGGGVVSHASEGWPLNKAVDLKEPYIYTTPSVSVEGGYGKTEFATQEDLVIHTGSLGCTVYTLWNHDPADLFDAAKYATSDIYEGEYGTLSFGDDGSGDGDWYLHVMAVNRYGLKNVYTSPYPYKIDRSKPNLTFTIDQNDICHKVFTIDATDSLSGLSKLEVLIDGTAYTVWDAEHGLDPDYAKLVNEKYVFSSHIKSDGIDGFHIDDRILSVMEKENVQRRKFKIAFRATDFAKGPTGSNVVTGPVISVTYDTRENFLVDMSFDGVVVDPESAINRVGANYPVYDINKESVSVLLTPQAGQDMMGATVFVIDENGNEYPGDQPLTLGPGYHELTPIARGTDADGEFELVSNSFTFYLTNHMSEQTTNAKRAKGNIVLSNKVFRLYDTTFTYLGGTDIVTVMHSFYGAVLDPGTGKYTGGSFEPTFSDSTAASRYIRSMEYQDMQLIKLDSDQAGYLNGGASTKYSRADFETEKAQSGQLWIRYKRKTWTQNSDVNGGWAYYFYAYSGDVADGIDINRLSANLKGAVNDITDYILKFGQTVNLVGDERSAATGAPYLLDSQIHAEREVFDRTRAGSPLVPNVIFEADSAIFHNQVTEGLISYPLATNLYLRADPGTYLFVKGSAPDAEFSQLTIAEGKEETLRNLLIRHAGGGEVQAGVYVLREIDATGVCDFPVYVDTQMPVVQAQVSRRSENGDSDITENTDLSAGQGTIAGTKLTFIGFKDEIDPEAYVAVYTYSLQNLVATYYAADFAAGVTLQTNNYYIEVGDRSGNTFSFYLILSDTKMETEVRENSSGTGIIVHVSNRTADEIFRYEVHLNNENLEVDKDKLLDKGDSFYQAGAYSILIQDIFGNTYSEPFIFNYKVPDVTWYYMSNDGEYHRYVEANDSGQTDLTVTQGMTKKSVGDLNYLITASTTLRLAISDSIGTPAVSFSGLEPEDYRVSEDSRRGDGTIVEIYKLTDWSLRVYYEEHPENVISYSCTVDLQAPVMEGTYVALNFKRNELSALEKMALDAPPTDAGKLVYPPALTYSKDNGSLRALSSGDVFSGNCITVSFRDSSGISSLKVLRDGKEIEVEPNQLPLIFNEYGKYEITVSDKLGNEAYYTFVNEPPESGYFYCDGIEVPADTVELAYGHDTVRMTTLNECECEILIHADGKDYYFRYLVDEGCIYQAFYQYTEGNEDSLVIQSVVISNELLSNRLSGYLIGKPVSLLGNRYAAILFDNFGIEAEENLPFEIFASLDANGGAAFTVELKRGTIDVEMRTIADNGKTPAYQKVELSDHLSDVPVCANEKDVTLPHDGSTVYITGGIVVFPEGEKYYPLDPMIVSVDMYLSTDRENWELYTLYVAGVTDPLPFFSGTEGFYRLEILNKYGNRTVVEFTLSGAFLSTSVASYQDGMKQNWVNTEEGITVYSNDSVTVSAYSERVSFTVNGVATEAQNQQNVLTIIFTNNGDDATYEVVMTDLAGNSKKVTVVIGTDPDFAFSENWLTGYSERALRKDEGYTSDKLSVKLDDAKKVSIVTVCKEGGEPVTVYNSIGGTPVIDPDLLLNCVGQEGDGVYEVVFRDVFGDRVSKTVHYRSTPTLSLSRITSFSGSEEPFDLGLALTKGFYSNRTLIFTTCAEKYVFKIKTGDDEALISLAEPKILEFTSSSGVGTIPYDVTYVDEYGMSYAFQAVLNRQTDLIDTTGLSMKTVDGVLYTPDDVSFLLPDGVTAYVSVDRATRVPYESGKIFRADSRYGFTFVDFSGNVQNFTVVHDSVAHFTVRDAASDTAIVNGSAVNAKTVVFTSDVNDTSFILRAFHDGEERTLDSNAISETGHWELLVSDAVGNVEYFAFDLLNHPVSEYHFDAPYGYVISEVWCTDAEGNKQLAVGTTSQEGHHLDLTIEAGTINTMSYAVILLSEYDNNAINFTVQLDNTPPQAKIVGVDEEGGATPYEVTFTDVIGNTVTVYKDGKMISKMYVETPGDIPVIKEGGKYKVEIRNAAGVVQTFQFTKKYIANTAASVLMIVACLGVSTCIFIGLLLRNRSKTDD